MQEDGDKTSLLSPLIAWALPPPYLTPTTLEEPVVSSTLVMRRGCLACLHQREVRMKREWESEKLRARLRAPRAPCGMGDTETSTLRVQQAENKGEKVLPLNQRASVAGADCCRWKVSGLLHNSEVWGGAGLRETSRVYLPRGLGEVQLEFGADMAALNVLAASPLGRAGMCKQGRPRPAVRGQWAKHLGYRPLSVLRQGKSS